MLDTIIRGSLIAGALVASMAQADDPVLRVREDAQRDRLWILKPAGVHL